MPLSFDIDDKLIEAARRIGGHATNDDAVAAALEEYVRRRKQLDVVQLFGTIDYELSYDHKTTRRRNRTR